MFGRKIDTKTSRQHVLPDPVHWDHVDIDLSDLASQADPEAAARDRGWLESSRDLQRGMRMRETPLDSLPDDVVEALLKRRP